MKRKIFLWAVLIVMTVVMPACKGAELHATVTLTEQWWSGWTEEQPEPTVKTFTDVAEGTVLYDSAFDATITVSDVTEEAIVLQIEHSCFTEPNEDGSISTEISISIYDEETGKEVLIPTVIDGKIVDDDTAIDHYYETGEYLGRFDTPEEAEEEYRNY